MRKFEKLKLFEINHENTCRAMALLTSTSDCDRSYIVIATQTRSVTLKVKQCKLKLNFLKLFFCSAKLMRLISFAKPDG
jgi:hypothetical protein